MRSEEADDEKFKMLRFISCVVGKVRRHCGRAGSVLAGLVDWSQPGHLCRASPQPPPARLDSKAAALTTPGR